jgi:hypothetical protein
MVTLAAPAAASAAGTVQPAAPCVRYVPTDPPAPTLGLTAEGWAPGSTLTFKVGAREVGIGQTDTAGGFTTGQSPFTPPEPKGNLQSTTLTADDGAGGFASSPLKIVRLTVDVPDRAKPSQRVRYRAFGFRPGARLYLFVRRGGKTRGRFVLGRPKGACGTLAKRLRYMPLRTWKPGLYEYWYSQSARYSKTTRIYGYRIRISRS